MPEGDRFFCAPSFASRLKHDILERYLRVAFTVMGRGTGREIVYADLFAGPGQYEDGTPASPLIAATIAAERAAAGGRPVRCFNVERGRVNFAKLRRNLSRIPEGIVTNQPGDWRQHMSELKELIEGRAAIIFIDPFELGVDLEEIGDLIEEIGPEPRDLILRLDMQGLQRTVGLKSKYDRDRVAAAVYGGDIGMEVRDHFRTANAVLGGRWWQKYIVDGDLPEGAFPPLIAELSEQLETIGVDKGPRRRTAAVPIPFALDGDTFYFLILLSRSGKAITLFNDAVEGAFTAAYRAKEGPRRATAQNVALFDDFAPPAHTYAARQAATLEEIAGETAAFVQRRPWGATFQEIHEEMADGHLGAFNATHLREIARDLERRGLVAIDPGAIKGSTRLRVAGVRGATG